MNLATREDYYWLVSSDAAPLINDCQEAILKKTNVVRIAKSLRKQTTPARSAIILELAQLRIKAQKKFPFADEMFLTRRGYEQSTSGLIAEYKAKKFSSYERIADVCCGIGGDLMYLANRQADCETIGIDSDPLVCLFARHNLVAAKVPGHAEIAESVFDDFDLTSFEAVHIDPDRRVHGRTVQSNFFSPTTSEIFKRVSSGNLAIKLAPASPTPVDLPSNVEREWIGDRRECKQQVLWCGSTASRPDALTATCVNKDGSVEQISVGGDEIDQTIVIADNIGQYIFEPHPCILAAKLTDTIGNRSRLARIAPTIAYLTGDDPLSTSLLTRYRVLKIFPLSTRIVAQELASLNVGQIEVKNRGVEKLLTEQFARIKLDGKKRLTVILTRHNRRGTAIIAQRQLS